MSSTINASTASGGGVITSADASGILKLQTAGVDAITVDASQNVTLAKGLTVGASAAPAFSAYQTGTAQVFNGTSYNKVVLNAEEFDTNSNFDSTTNYRFTPTVAGYYQVNGCINLAGGANLAIAIYKNGSVFKYGSGSTSSGITSDNVAALISMNGSTDYIELWGYSNVTATLVATVSSTYFQAFLARSA